MSEPNVALIRRAYAAYESGDAAAMLALVDPDLEWTYLGPGAIDRRPQLCQGRGELPAALAQRAQRGLRAQLQEVIGHRDKVVVAVRTPGADAYCTHRSDDRNYAVVTVRDGRIVALRDWRNRVDALARAGIEEHP
jgi:ketosteroid isomerase-like protein